MIIQYDMKSQANLPKYMLSVYSSILKIGYNKFKIFDRLIDNLTVK